MPCTTRLFHVLAFGNRIFGERGAISLDVDANTGIILGLGAGFCKIVVRVLLKICMGVLLRAD
jgi:hypothetical protein